MTNNNASAKSSPGKKPYTVNAVTIFVQENWEAINAKAVQDTALQPDNDSRFHLSHISQAKIQLFADLGDEEKVRHEV